MVERGSATIIPPGTRGAVVDFLGLELIEYLFDEGEPETDEPLSNRYIEYWRVGC